MPLERDQFSDTPRDKFSVEEVEKLIEMVRRNPHLGLYDPTEKGTKIL